MKTLPGATVRSAKAAPSEELLAGEAPLGAVASPTGQLPLIEAEAVPAKPAGPLISARTFQTNPGTPGPYAAALAAAPAAVHRPNPPAPGPAVPATPSLPTLERGSSPHASLYEQLQAIEEMESVAQKVSADQAPRELLIKPAEGKVEAVPDSEITTGRAPTLATAAPPAHSEESQLELGKGADEQLELDRGGWKPEVAAPAPPPIARPKPVERVSGTPGPYARIAPARFTAPEPPSRGRLVMGALVLAAAGIAVASVILSAQTEEAAPADPEPAQPPVFSAPVVAPEPAAPAAAVVPVEQGTLRLVGVPKGARVVIDGAQVDKVAAPLAYPAGPHEVRVEAKGMANFESTVEVAPNKTYDLKVVLKKAPKTKKKK